ncbi:hypothetical protein HPB48_017831 [Haemaphysalis longicornis]|uniref:Uncharacterized protein n=1 Tax=Haemaphysalis longicornis TaxID=44386 RepID=A0A9J6GBF9_HAELO|nr:hypothetical protein HPB48_017831 [Haemaphysalis longicornis]
MYVTQKLFQCVYFDECVTFRNISIHSLPRETRLYLTVIGHREGVDQVLGWSWNERIRRQGTLQQRRVPLGPLVARDDVNARTSVRQ